MEVNDNYVLFYLGGKEPPVPNAEGARQVPADLDILEKIKSLSTTGNQTAIPWLSSSVGIVTILTVLSHYTNWAILVQTTANKFVNKNKQTKQETSELSTSFKNLVRRCT